MNMQIDPGHYSNLEEIYSIGTQGVQVYSRNHRLFRVYAEKMLRGNEKVRFCATADEALEIQVSGQSRQVWTRFDLPWVSREDLESAMRQALGFIDDACAEK